MIPRVPRSRSLADAPGMVRNPVTVLERYRRSYGPSFFFHFGGVRRAFVTTDAEVLQHVLKGNKDNYPKSNIQVERMVEFQGKGLVNSHGSTWLRQRRLLAKGFQPAYLQALLPMQQQVLHQMLPELRAEGNPVDARDFMVRLTLRLIGRSLFGGEMSDAELSQIGDAISQIQEFIVRQIVRPYLIPWYRVSGQSAQYQRIRRAADALVLKHIQARKLSQGGTDFLGLMLDTPYPDSGEKMNEQQLLIESLQLLVAGNETSSNALTWTCYLLAQHPQYVEALRADADQVLSAEPLQVRQLQKLSQTLMVIEEALRLFPPFWMIDRQAMAVDDLSLAGLSAELRIPKGTLVIPYIYGTHRNPEYWREPERFVPTRFTPEAKQARPSFAYLPFGGGPRICIGNSLAVTQMLMILSTLTQHFDLKLDGPERLDMHPMMLLRPRGAVRLCFIPRAGN